MTPSRRRFLFGAGAAALAAPAIIRLPGLLMPVHPVPNLDWSPLRLGDKLIGWWEADGFSARLESVVITGPLVAHESDQLCNWLNARIA